MKKLIYILLFLVAANANAQDKSLFDQATEHYSNQDYKAAIDDYKKILSQGKTSTAVYFNLANAHYKLDHIAPSIYYYNKALQLSPNDKDVKNNLAFAQKMTIDSIDKVPKTGMSKFFDGLISTFNFNTWAVLAIVFSIMFAVFGIWYYFSFKTGRKRFFFTLSTLGLVFGILSVVFAYQQFNSQQNKKYAIVFAKQAAVHAEPNNHSAQAFTLHEGTKVKVLENFKDYTKIKLTDGKQGWIAEKAIKGL